MNLYLTEDGNTKVYVYKKDIHPDNILEDVRHHASGVGRVVRNFNTVYSDGPIRFTRPLYCTAEIS